MSRAHWSRTVVALGLTATLGTLPAWAEPQIAADGRPGRLAAAGALSQLWSLLTGLLGDVGCIIDPHGGCGAAQTPVPAADVGCIIDPNGGCGTAQAPVPPPETEVGCILDPYGGCTSGSGSQSEAGCILDPHGGCAEDQSTSATDAGCGLDPHGSCSH